MNAAVRDASVSGVSTHPLQVPSVEAVDLEQSSHRESAVSSGSCHQTVTDLFSDLDPLSLAAFLLPSLTSCTSFFLFTCFPGRTLEEGYNAHPS